MAGRPPLDPFEVLHEAPGLPAGALTEELERVYGAGLGFDEPCLVANFVSTVDGVVAIPSVRRSNDLIAGGNDADRFLMGLLRALSGVVVVGSGVLRESPEGTWLPEKVFPPASEAFAELRRARGLPARPEVAVVTGSGSIDPTHPVLAAGAVVLTTDAGAARLEGALPEAASLVALPGEDVIDARLIVDALVERGHRLILSEAGPHTFGTFLAAGVVDELFLTVSPLLVGDAGPGSRFRLVEWADLVPPLELRPVSLRRHGTRVFHRFAVAAPS